MTNAAKALLDAHGSTQADQFEGLCQHLRHIFVSQNIHCHNLKDRHNELVTTNIRLCQELESLSRQFVNEDLLVAFYRQAFQKFWDGIVEILEECQPRHD
ncbi:hypothetical protein N7516_000616 [Penicillium verrucosum]|uniref:uncharacterized protein n=1 Tax=Penicillium verrucosum TaxID=60171 RepID=UPI0025453AE5|nr:uncharacterized protein N7516_000616 [Penicillium verrucosum]KAJ5940448.1 hypothetical protein N7516_000616 [Penicillium verrucosum]